MNPEETFNTWRKDQWTLYAHDARSDTSFHTNCAGEIKVARGAEVLYCGTSFRVASGFFESVAGLLKFSLV